MVELMVVVAIIGILAAVAIPNFKKYQAKTRTSEAKIALAAAFSAESVFKEEFDIYHKCLSYMGFQLENDQASRFYTVGFGEVDSIDSTVYTSSLAINLVEVDCPNDTTLNVDSQIFLAGKTVGAVAPISTLEAALSEDGSGGTFLGTQADSSNKNFVIAAIGIIYSEVVDPNLSSLWTINQDKRMVQIRPGY